MTGTTQTQASTAADTARRLRALRGSDVAAAEAVVSLAPPGCRRLLQSQVPPLIAGAGSVSDERAGRPRRIRLTRAGRKALGIE